VIARGVYYRPLKIITANHVSAKNNYGVYSFKTLAQCINTFEHKLTKSYPTYFRGYWEIPVLVKIAFWGKVVEHEYGYRSEFAYPQLFFITDFNEPYIQRLSNKWKIESNRHPYIEKLFVPIRMKIKEENRQKEEFKNKFTKICEFLKEEFKKFDDVKLSITPNELSIKRGSIKRGAEYLFHLDDYSSEEQFLSRIWNCMEDYYKQTFIDSWKTLWQ